MALGGLYEAYAKLPKFDVFIAHLEKDESLVWEIKEVFQKNGVTYTTPEDYWKAKEYVLTSVGPSPIRDSYFFLLIDEQSNLNEATIQDWLWHAAQLNKSLLVLDAKKNLTFNKEDKLQDLISRVQNEPREPDWIYGKRRQAE